MRTAGQLIRSAADLGGGALRVAIAALGAVRPEPRPLHPRGTVRAAELVRHGSSLEASGVAWIDEGGTDPALVRASGGIGLPAGWPDVQGLAIQVHGDHAPIDILLATTGTGRLTRFLLVPRTGTRGRALTTLMPYRSPRGPLLLAAVPTADDDVELSWALGTGPWVGFATLHLHQRSPWEPTHDPVLNPPPGLDTYGWTRRLREPSYAYARRRRES